MASLRAVFAAAKSNCTRRHPSTKPRPRSRPAPKPRPSDSWPAWTDEVRYTTSDAASDTCEIRPTHVAPSPTPREEAWQSGFNRGYLFDADARPPGGIEDDVAASWWTGWNVGAHRRELDEIELVRLARQADEIRETDIYAPGQWS